MHRTLTCAAAALLCSVAAIAEGPPPDLLLPTLAQPDDARSEAALEATTALVDSRVWEEPSVLLDLLPGLVRRVRKDRIERRGATDFTWRGHLEGDDARSVVFSSVDGFVSGLVETDVGTFEIRSKAAGVVEVALLDQALFPPCGTAGEGEQRSVAGDGNPGSVVPGSVRSGGAFGAGGSIDVLVAYTATARSTAGGTAAIRSTIQAAVDAANTAFENSGMATRFRLVGSAEVAYAESGDLATDLAWVAGNTGVAGLRDDLDADLVSLFVEDGGGECGRGYVLSRNVDPGAFAPNAFQVTKRSCAVGNLSYVHEHGHNLGMQHNPENGAPPSQAARDWAFGHYVDGSFRTVMSYSNPCAQGCPRVPYFSNPAISHLGSPTGIAGQRDNHLVGDEFAEFAKDWRVSEELIFAAGFESGDFSDWSSFSG